VIVEVGYLSIASYDLSGGTSHLCFRLILVLENTDDRLMNASKHPQAQLWPSKVVTLAILHALKGVGNRAFYRLFRLFKTHWYWSHAFMAETILLGVVDTMASSCCIRSAKAAPSKAVEDRILVLSDSAFHAAKGDPVNLKVCKRGQWNDRMMVETVLSMFTTISHLKKVAIGRGKI
jgi:hypothetical protein